MPPRNRISLKQRERIVHAFEDVHEDYLAIAQTITITNQSKDNRLKLRNNFEILFPFIVCHYYTNV